VNITFQRLVDRFAGVPICFFLSLLERFRSFIFGPPHLSLPPSRILVILLSEMGSVVLAHPMLTKLRQQYAEASLHILMFSKNREVIELLGVLPTTHVISFSDSSLWDFTLGLARAIRTIRSLKFDVVIDCELFSRISSIISCLSGAPIRIGFHPHTQEGLYRGSFISRPVLYNPYHHISQQFLNMVSTIEAHGTPLAKNIAPETPAPPLLFFEQGELEQVRAKLLSDFPVLMDKKLVLIHPDGGALPCRAWPLEYFKTVCQSLLQGGYAVGLIGLQPARPLAVDILTYCDSPACINLVGYTKSIRHLLAIYNHAALLIANDGGPGQFAALTKLPTILFFGPETPTLYGPLSGNIHCMHRALSCSPCVTAYNHRNSPCDGDNQCLKQIMPEKVIRKAFDLLRQPMNT